MAQSGYTPIQLYYSTTAAAAPTSGNLANGELAINITDGKLFYKDNSGNVQVIAGGGITIPQVIDVNSSSNALRITQTGAGNALLVEDSTNPDSTPFVVDASGNAIQGYTALLSFTAPAGTLTPTVQSISQASSLSQGIASTTHVSSGNGPNIVFGKSRGASASSPTIVSSGDVSGNLIFSGYDGATYLPTAYIQSLVDGTPGTNDMPGRLVFSTTADGASSPTERMRIDSAGSVGIGGTPSAGQSFVVSKNATGSTTTIGAFLNSQVQSDVTAAARSSQATLSTANASFTLSELSGYSVYQGTIGGLSTVTNQYGFVAGSNMTGATNNYGFWSDKIGRAHV